MFLENPVILVIVLFLGFLITGLSGACLTAFLPVRLVREKELSLFHGLLFLVGMFALMTTGAKTILILIFGYFLIQPGDLKKFIPQQPDFKTAGVQVVRSFLFSVPLFLLFYKFIFRSDGSVFLPFMDEVFYSKIAAFLNDGRIETNDLHCFWFNSNCGNIPYHYFEIWLAALLSKATGISSLLTYKLIAVPLIMGISADILFQAARLNKLSIPFSIIAVLLVLFSGLFWGYQSIYDWSIPQTLKVQLHFISDFIPLNRVKLSTVLLFFSAFIFLNLNKVKLSWLPLLLCGGLWISIAPSLWTLAFVVFIVEGNYRVGIFRFAGFLLFASSVLFFLYYFNRDKLAFDDSIVFLKYTSMRIIGGTIFYEFISHLIILSPLLIFLPAVFKSSKIVPIVLVLFSTVPGIIFHSLTIGAVDSFQFVSNISPIAVSILFFLFWIEFVPKLKSIKMIPVFGFLGIQLFFCYKTIAYSFSNYTYSYSSAVIKKSEQLAGSGKIRIVTLSKGKGGFSDMPRTSPTAAGFLFGNARASILQINSEEIKSVLKGSFSEGIKQVPFLRYAEAKGNLTPRQARSELLKEYKPEFLVISEGIEIDDYPELKPFATPLLRDSISGESIFGLNY